MAKTDASVKGLLMFWSLPIRSAVWGLNARPPDGMSEPDAAAVAIRDAVNWQFGIEQRDDSLARPVVEGAARAGAEGAADERAVHRGARLGRRPLVA
jgi:hypothetical protein